MDEDYYALSKLARTVFGTNDLDHRRDDGAGLAEEPIASRASRADAVTYDDVERAKVILVAGLDAEQEVPILHLRLRKAARRGAKIFVLHPRRTRLYDVAEHILCRPGDEQDVVLAARRPDIAEALREAGADGVVIAGPRLADAGTQRLGRRASSPARPARGSPTSPAGRTTAARSWPACIRRSCPEGGGSASPTSAPRSRAGLGTDHRRRRGPELVGHPGGVRRARHRRVVPDRRRPAPRLPRRGARARGRSRTCDHVVVQSLELGSLEPYADAFLPAAAFLEKEGHVTTWEGRNQRIRPIRGAAGIALPDWEIFASLALAAGGDLGFETLDELHEEMGRLLAPRERRGCAVAGSAPAAARRSPRARSISSRTRCWLTRAASPSAPTS